MEVHPGNLTLNAFGHEADRLLTSCWTGSVSQEAVANWNLQRLWINYLKLFPFEP